MSEVRVPLQGAAYGPESIREVVDSLERGAVTAGEKVARFEREFAERFGVPHAILVNSGSSANLLMLSALAQASRLSPGDEVIVPAVTWGTQVWPIAQVGCVPVLVDVCPRTLALDPGKTRAAITSRTRAIFVAHLLGMGADLAPFEALAREHGLILLEDACESIGALSEGRFSGTVGFAGSFSFYFSHQLSMIEGGLVATRDAAFADLVRSLRSHGWAREKNPGIESRFWFTHAGYSLRSNELQAGIGLHALRALDGRLEARRQLGLRYARELGALWGRELLGFGAGMNPKPAWLGFPVLLSETLFRARPRIRSEFCAHLESRGVETRPILAGNLSRHPAMAAIGHRVEGALPVADAVSDRGLYWSCDPALGDDSVSLIVQAVKEFF